MAPTLSILIVSYNTCAMTLACLRAIAAETRDTSYEIIVVDNASSDGSAEAIAAETPGLKLMSLGQNVGFARANNLAAAEARGEFLLLLNPDTLVQDQAIDRLVAFSRRRPEARIWGGRTQFADGRLNPSSAWGRMTLWRLLCRATGLTSLAARTSLFNGEAMGGWSRDTEREVDVVSGCFLMVSREDWQRLGGFDPTFFMYGEEADLCLRARELGAKPAVTPSATIIHYGGASEATREGKMVKLLAAKATLIDRHFPRFAKSPGLILHAAWPLTRWLVLSLAARLAHRPALAAGAAVWGRIWQRRTEWRHGWRRGPTNELSPSAGTSSSSAAKAT